uniref:lysozyme n=1 Tax=Seriola lalandi dorsalis TaxID=1841481 RepID=A0A3B4XTD2_SERLL
MKVLEVFLLAALGCSLTEAWLVSKCDLKDQLLRATDEQRGKSNLAELELPSTTPPPARERRGAQEVWTLYGIFQLSNYLVCNDGTTPSPNICGLSCSNLVDDDIRDDINCVLKILAYLL